MVTKLVVVGIGPGSPEYMIPAAQKEIATADAVVGGRRALDTLASEWQQKIPITGKLGDLKTELERLSEHLQWRPRLLQPFRLAEANISGRCNRSDTRPFQRAGRICAISGNVAGCRLVEFSRSYTE